MLSWRGRGPSVWIAVRVGRRRAANFGSQGTRVESLLRRMQHGELDGYQAKLHARCSRETPSRKARSVTAVNPITYSLAGALEK